MACAISLLDRMNLNPGLSGVIATGGVWTFTSTTNGSNDLTVSLNGAPNITVVPGVVIGSTDNPSLNFDGSADADYVFTYTTGGGGACQDDATLTVTVAAGVTAGVDFSTTLCTVVSENRNLYDILTGGNGLTGPGAGSVTIPGSGITGVWTGTGISSPGYSAGAGVVTDDTFNPSLATVGTYTFTYTVDRTTAVDCLNCQDTATITFIVSDAPYPGLDSTVTVCSSPA